MKKPNKKELIKIGQWLMDGDTGLSSLALASFYLTAGNGGECASRLPAPSDPSDFGRCIRFLKKCLSKKHQFDLIYAIGETTKGWKQVRYNWFELLSIYNEEKNQESAPRLYQFMKEIGL
jgi:hypothetical protein